MDIYLVLICVVLGYLIGSFSIARLITHIAAPEKELGKVEVPDRNTGGTIQLKTVGATTASMILGPKIGGLIGILDILKGAIPALVVRLFFPDQSYFLLTGIAVVIGHVWPIYYRFRGGGGLSPALGTLLVLDPLGTLVSVILAFLIGLFLLKEISFMVMGGPILFIFLICIKAIRFCALFPMLFLDNFCFNEMIFDPVIIHLVHK